MGFNSGFKGLSVATPSCNVYPDKCWFTALCRFWLQCSRTLRQHIPPNFVIYHTKQRQIPYGRDPDTAVTNTQLTEPWHIPFTSHTTSCTASSPAGTAQTMHSIHTLPTAATVLATSGLATNKSVVQWHLVLQYGVRSNCWPWRSRFGIWIYRIMPASPEQPRRICGAGGPNGSHAIQLPLEPVLPSFYQRRVNALLRQQ